MPRYTYIEYEWVAELVEDGEVMETTPCPSYSAAVAMGWTDVALMRQADNGRLWAYVKDGRLPTHFTDVNGNALAIVPKRFIREVEGK